MLTGKCVFITGGASGIGKCCAQTFLNYGANVVIMDFCDEEKLIDVQKELGSNCWVIYGDVTRTESVEAAGDPIPDAATITVARKSDKSQLEFLIVEDEDALNVFDRGYLHYKQFDYYSGKGIRFVTRLKNNACVAVLRELEVDEESVIEEDLIVRLGKGQNRMEHDLRLVITKDTEGKAVMILTNDFNITAEEIGVIYRYRWSIMPISS